MAHDVRDIAVLGDHLLEEPLSLGADHLGVALAKFEMMGVYLIGEIDLTYDLASTDNAALRPALDTLGLDDDLGLFSEVGARASRASAFASRPLAAT